MSRYSEPLTFFYKAGFIYLVGLLCYLLGFVGMPIYYKVNFLDINYLQQQVLIHGLARTAFTLATYIIMGFGVFYGVKLCLETPYKIVFYGNKIILRNVFMLNKIIYKKDIKNINMKHLSHVVSEVFLEFHFGRSFSFRMTRNEAVDSIKYYLQQSK
jgi:hypothetical protein